MYQNIVAVNPPKPIIANIPAGSALLKPILQAASHGTSLLCAVSNVSDADALSDMFLVHIVIVNRMSFISALGMTYRHAIAVSPKGKPLTGEQIARLI